MRFLNGHLIASLCAATIAAGAPIAAHAAAAKVTIGSLSVSQPASAGSTVTFTASLTANQSVSGYPIEFSFLAPGATNGTNEVEFVTLPAGKATTETFKVQLPANAKAGAYTLLLNVYNPSWAVPSLAAAKTTFQVGTTTSTPTPPPTTPTPPTSTPVNGTCGSANGVLSTTAPTGGLCSAGTASKVTGSSTSSWSWSCAGSNGGTTAVCATPAAPSAPTSPTPPTSVTFKPGTTVQPGPNAALYASPFYSCVRNFYVSTTGSDSNAGTSSSPWQTIQHADSASRQAGDCINVAAGTYKASVLVQHGGSAPTPTGYVAYRCETLDGCHVLAQNGGHLWGFRQPANFVVVDGFELDGNSALGTPGIADACIDTDGDTYGTGNASHHIWALNNIIHNCNESGVQFNNKEWFYVINNTIYNNSGSSGFQGSGLSLVVVQCIETSNAACASGSTYAGGTGTYTPSGMDLTYAAPYHNIISGNRVYNNSIAANNPVGCGSHTDGNGIILDTFLDETKNSIVYPYQTLVGGNVSYANGGRGIHVFRTSNVTVANNTVYGNGTDTCINAFYLSDLSQAGGSNNVWANNVAQSVQTAVNASCGQFCGGRNAPLTAGDSAGITDSNNTYTDNVLFGGAGVQLFNADVNFFSCSKNKCATNPMLDSPTASNFGLQSASPAIGYGFAGYYVQTSPVDAGACSRSLASCL